MAQSIYRLNSFLSAFIKNWLPQWRDHFPSSTKRCPISAEFNGPRFAYTLTRGTCRCRKYNRGSHGGTSDLPQPQTTSWESQLSWPLKVSRPLPFSSLTSNVCNYSVLSACSHCGFSQFLVLHQQPFGFSVLGCCLASLGSLHPFVSGHGSLALLCAASVSCSDWPALVP